MALIGKNISLGLSDQIRVRQEKLGKNNLTTEDIVFTNSNTSWIRAASSVNIENQEQAGLRDISGIAGSKAAENGILMGGITNYEGSVPFEALAKDTNSLETSVVGHYGWGGNTPLWGYSPPPSLQSLTIKSLNRGAIRKAELSIIAHNPDQFRIIDTLYLRLGYTILVEWGHSIYYTNEKKLITNPNFATRPFNAFMGKLHKGTEVKGLLESLNRSEGGYLDDPFTLAQQLAESLPPTNFDTIGLLIEQEKLEANYNYDGFIGYVSNFNWKYNPDGTYVANVSVITKGGLIESLKVNHASTHKNSSYQGHSQTLTVILDEWEKALQSDDSGVALGSGNFQYNAASFYGQTQNSTFNNLFEKDAELVVYNAPVELKEKRIYCTLGLLLRVIEKRCLFYDKDKNPLIKIDHKYGNSFMLRHPFQNSLDPNVCMMFSSTPQISVEKEDEGVNTLEATTIPSNAEFTENFLSGEFGAFTNTNVFKGDIMSILVNLDFIRKMLVDSESKSGDVSLKDFISNLLNGIAKVTGNINKFHLSFNEITNTFEIYDDVTIPNDRISQGNSPSPINIYSQKEVEGSFVKDISFSSKIFPKIQNLVAIAAQNPSDETIGEQVGSYQRLNRGLRDRIANGGLKTFETLTSGGSKNPYTTYSQAIYNISNYFDLIYNKGGFITDSYSIKEMQTSLNEILTYDLQWRSHKNQLSSPFFMPLELSITLHGISGFKLFEQFDITPDYILPQYIPNNLKFIIQGITHDLKGGEWTTTLTALSYTYSANIDFDSSQLEIPIAGCTTPDTSTSTSEMDPDRTDPVYANDEGTELEYPSLGNGERFNVQQLTTSQEGLNLIKEFEGFRANAYVDPASGGEPITIGYGTIKYSNGSKVVLGDTITEQEAENELRSFVQNGCEQAIKKYVKVPTTQQEFDAIVSWLYNCGTSRIKPGNSTLGKLLNNKQYLAAANEFPKWNKAAGKEMAGLTRRRIAERSLYLTNNPGDPIT